jgi:molecular chaperone DnaK (HSP70)
MGIWRNGRVDIIPNSNGERTTPSVISFTETERLIGTGAKNHAARNPKNTIYDVKRLMDESMLNYCAKIRYFVF